MRTTVEENRADTLLIAEDNDDLRAGIARILREHGFQVLEAADGAHALRCASGKPGLVLLDVRLPDMDGLDVCERLKSDPQTAGVPILMLSGAATSPEERVEGLERGADAYLVKPVDVAELLTYVRTLLRVRRAEAALREREELYRLLTENANDLICLVSVEGAIVYTSPSVLRFLGVIPRSRFDHIHADDRSVAHQSWDRVIEGSKELLRFRLGSDRTGWKWVESWWSLVRYRGTSHVMMVSREVSLRHEVEAALRERDERLDLVLESLPVGVAVMDADGNIVRHNRASERIWAGVKISADERYLQSRGWWHSNGQPIGPQEWASVRALRKGETSVNELIDIESYDGARKVIRNSACPLHNVNQEVVGVVVINEDVTERLKLEGQLRQAQKMEAIGHLASGVAHDFNNLLTIICGYSELLFHQTPSYDSKRNYVAEIREAGERGAGLTRQLLAFSRQSVLAPRVLDLNEVVRDNERMLRRLIGEDIELTAILESSLMPVRVDPGQVSQVIMNLAVNARDAMPMGGKLTIETANIRLDEAFSDMHPEVQPGQYILLAMTDTGCGMSAEVQNHLFEPFFTTKAAGKGTGLGLATVYGIVKQSEGFIYVYSEAGRGTTFKTFFPVAKSDVSTGRSEQRMRATFPGTETILVVEDEDAVRTMIGLILRQAGYQVLEANRAAEAIQQSTEHSEAIHLLITDVVMPDMGGRQLAERLQQLRPEIKVLYTSGYTDDAVVRHGILQADVAFLQKPFSVSTLTSKVREVLGAAREPS